jgi:ribosome-associated toxin RatA of RatAB toxin-antitoxin module
MSDEAREKIIIAATPKECFDAVCQFERYPEWATDVKQAEIVDHDAEGRGSRVRYEVSAYGITIGYVLDYDYSYAPRRLSWKLVSSEVLRTLDGSYTFEEDPVSDGATAVTYRLLVDLTMPMPSLIKKAAATKIASTAMREFKRFVEAGA